MWGISFGGGNKNSVPFERIEKVLQQTESIESVSDFYRAYEKLPSDTQEVIEALKDGIAQNGGRFESEDNQRLNQLVEMSGIPEKWLRPYIAGSLEELHEAN